MTVDREKRGEAGLHRLVNRTPSLSIETASLCQILSLMTIMFRIRNLIEFSDILVLDLQSLGTGNELEWLL